MSIFAGILTTSGATSLDSGATNAIQTALERSGDTASTYSDDRLFLAKVNVGAIDELNLSQTPDGICSALAGEPFFEADASTQRTREQDLALISAGIKNENVNVLARCRGSFALASYIPSEPRLVLATDSMGIRPLFYYVAANFLAFSTALHVLEAMDCVPKILDPVGAFESVGFGYPLADRTHYMDIKVLRSAEALVWEKGAHQIRTYFAWDEISVSESPIGNLADDCHERFMSAIALRAKNPQPIAFLSGGLDSRSIVGGLMALQKPVVTVNVVRQGKLDTLLAERFASAVGCELIKIEAPPSEDQPTSMWKAFQRINWTSDHDVTSPNPWFSGDGGSVGLGHVYIDPDHVERIRDGDIESFCRYALDQRGLPFNWFYKKKVFDTLRRLVENDIRNELERIPNAEPGRRFHLWLMDNDQRRHLHSQFENIDHSRREHLTPFFDTEFMKAVITIPVDRCLLHEFYHEWMKRLPAAVSSTPWQAYPTHLPCPIPLDPSDAKARNQWETDRQDEWARAEPFAAHARRIVFGPTFAGAYLRRDRVLAGLSLNALHLKSVIGGLRTVSEYAGFLEKCEGRISPLS